MPMRRRSNAQRGFVAFPTDSAEFVSSKEGGLFVRLVVEYPAGAIPGTPSVRVHMDECYQGQDGPTRIEPDLGAFEGQELLDVMDRNQQAYEDELSRHFPYQAQIQQAYVRPAAASSTELPAWARPIASDDEYLGTYLAAVSVPNEAGEAASQVLDRLGELYRGFEHGFLGVSGDHRVMVVEHAKVYDYDWPLCCGGSCVVVRRSDNPHMSPYLSVPYAAVILLGSTGWSGY